MSDVINQAMEEVANTPKEEAPQEAEGQTLEQPIQDATEEVEEQDKVEEPEEESAPEPFPKKAVNAISRREKTISKQKAEIAELRKELDSLRSQAQPEPKSKEPNPDDYDDWDKFVSDLVEYKSGENKKEATPQPTEQEIREQIRFQEKEVQVGAKAAELAEKLPDYKALNEQNADILDSLPLDVVKAAFELENPALALYALAKEDKLEDLLEMSPYQATIALTRAEISGQKYLQPKATSAPAPISGVRGKPNQSKRSLEAMNTEELLDWARK